MREHRPFRPIPELSDDEAEDQTAGPTPRAVPDESRSRQSSGLSSVTEVLNRATDSEAPTPGQPQPRLTRPRHRNLNRSRAQTPGRSRRKVRPKGRRRQTPRRRKTRPGNPESHGDDAANEASAENGSPERIMPQGVDPKKSARAASAARGASALIPTIAPKMLTGATDTVINSVCVTQRHRSRSGAIGIA